MKKDGTVVLDNDFENYKAYSVLTLAEDGFTILSGKVWWDDLEQHEKELRLQKIKILKSLVGQKIKIKAGIGEVVKINEASLRAEI